MRTLRTRCIERFTTLHALPRLGSSLRGIFFRKVDDSAVTSQAVTFASLASDALVASSASVRSLVRTAIRLGRDRFSHPSREEGCLLRSKAPSIDRSELHRFVSLRTSAFHLSGERRPRPFGRGRACAAETDLPYGRPPPMKASSMFSTLFSPVGADLAALPPRSDTRHRFTRRGLPLWVSLHVCELALVTEQSTMSSIDFCNYDTLRGHTLSKVLVPRACLLAIQCTLLHRTPEGAPPTPRFREGEA